LVIGYNAKIKMCYLLIRLFGLLNREAKTITITTTGTEKRTASMTRKSPSTEKVCIVVVKFEAFLCSTNYEQVHEITENNSENFGKICDPHRVQTTVVIRLLQQR